MDFTPFRIDPQSEAISDLYARIDNARMPADLGVDENSRGIRPTMVAEYLNYWRTSFDWPRMVEHLNNLPHFITEIDGQRLHFLHIVSSRADATPLLLLHGFPGSFLEFSHVIEPLSNPTDGESAFHLVIPSHPGYTFSTPISKAWSSHSTAELYAKLMKELGYERYVAQGGDYGAFIAPDLGRVDADHVRGVHVNAASWGFIPTEDLSEEEAAALSERDQARYAHLQQYNDDLNWYFDVQAKRPQTISYGMADSPTALLSWLLNMFMDFSDHDAPLPENERNRDIFFANLTLYWLTNCFATAANPYWEGMHDWSNYPHNAGVPTGVAVFKQDGSMRDYSNEFNTITHWSNIDAGGHFAALETPDLLVDDIRVFVAGLS